MTDETKAIIRDALRHRERNYRGFASGDRMDAIACRRSGDPAIQARADVLEERAVEGERKAELVREAFDEFNREHP